MEQQAAIVNMAVAHLVIAGNVGRGIAQRGFPEFDAAGAEVAQFATEHLVIMAAARQFQAIPAQMNKTTTVEHALPNTISLYSAGNPDRRLRKAAHFVRRGRPNLDLFSAPGKTAWEIPLRVREGEPAESELPHPLVIAGLAFKENQLRERGRDHLGTSRIFARLRQVIQGAGGAVEVPLAGDIEQFEGVFDIIKVARIEFEHTALAEARQPVRFIDARDWQMRFHPAVHHPHLGVGDGAPRFQVAVFKPETRLALGPGRIGFRLRNFGDFEVAGIGMPGARAALAINPELVKNTICRNELRAGRRPKAADLRA